MQLVEIMSIIGSDVSTRPAFACGENGCHRQYDIDYGYYTVSGGQILGESTIRVPCPNDEHAMFFDQLDPLPSIRKWRCPQFECDGAKETRRATMTA